MRKPLLPAAVISTALFLLSACAQWWQVRPYPQFVGAEIRVGDTVRIETRAGARYEGEVSSVRRDRIVVDGQSCLLADIAELEKRSDSPPANPCSAHKPLGCSVPQWAAVLHDWQARYRDFFYPSCEQHDFCYRHGAVTYGKSKDVCDSEFLLDMQTQCQPEKFTDALLRAGDGYASCGAMALEFYLAVQKYGAGQYLGQSGSYCEYDGPP